MLVEDVFVVMPRGGKYLVTGIVEEEEVLCRVEAQTKACDIMRDGEAVISR